MKKFISLSIIFFLLAAAGAFGQKITLSLYKQEWVSNIQTVIGIFEKANPGIHIDTIILPYYEADGIDGRLARDQAPDIFQIYLDEKFHDYAKKGYLTDLTQESYWSGFYPFTKKSALYNQKNYAMPLDYFAIGVLYNKKIFKSLGLKVPNTYEELKQICQVIKSKGKTPFAGLMKENWSAGHFLGIIHTAMLEIQGGPGAFEKFLQKMNQGTASYSKAVDWPVIQRYLDFYRSNMEPNAREHSWDEQQSAFAGEKAAMIVQGLWSYAPAKLINPQLDVGFFPFPLTSDPAQSRFSVAIDSMMAISAHTSKEKQEAAKKFLRWLASADGQKAMVRELKLIPTVMGTDASALGTPMSDLQESLKARGSWPAGFLDYPTKVFEAPIKEVAHSYILRGKRTKATPPEIIDKVWRESVK